MARWIIGAGVMLLACVGAGVFVVHYFVGGIVTGIGTMVPQGYARQATLADYLGPQQPEAVAVYNDGTWGLITDVDGARAVGFSYFKDGFLRRLTDNGTCQNSADKVFIQPLVAGVMVDPIASCAHPDTDIAALAALARPAHEHWLPDLPIAEWREQAARVDRDPALFAGNKTMPQSDYDYACSYEFPFIWQADGYEGAYIMTRIDEANDAAIVQALGPQEERYEVRADNGYASSYVMYAEEGSETSAEGWAIETSTAFVKRGDTYRKIPGVSIYRPRLRLQGTRADCTSFGAIDFGEWEADRDIALLEAAWAAGVEETRGPGTALEWDDLVGMTQGRASVPQQQRYDFRYFGLN